MIPIIYNPNKGANKEINWKNTPIAFMTTKTVQKGTNRHFTYISKTASSMTKIPWMLCKPKSGHFIQAAEQIAVKFVPIVCIEADRECRNILQSLWKEANIVNTVSAKIIFITEAKPTPLIRGYYVSIPKYQTTTDRDVYMKYQRLLIDPLISSTMLTIVVVESAEQLIEKENKHIRAGELQRWKHSTQQLHYRDHSDKVGCSTNINTFAPEDTYNNSRWDFRTSPAPDTPIDFGLILYEPFNDRKYAVNIEQYGMQLEHVGKKNTREPSVKAIVKITNLEKTLGLQVYDNDHSQH
eukprot:6537808-Ditylum_brightwellii.AAC.1